MLACTALVGCTSDDLIENGGLEKETATRGNAYISVGFSNQTNSSRAGDTDGTTDDSQHDNAGTIAENTISEVLLVIAKCSDDTTIGKGDGTNTDNNYNLTAVTTDGTENGKVVTLDFADFEETTTGTYALKTQYRFDYLGNYKVLVVINPVDALKTAINGQNHVQAYKTIMEFTGHARTGTNADGNFMMTNKYQVVVKTDENNDTPDEAELAEVEVERVISKVTYRWKGKDATYPGSLATMINVHDVPTPLVKHTAVTGTFWYKKEISATTSTQAYDEYYYDTKFNKATHTDGKTYWVLLNNDFSEYTVQITETDVVAAFTANAEGVEYEEYIGLLNGQTEPTRGSLLPETFNIASERINDTFVQGLTFVTTTTTDSNQKYYVHLTHYALTNLSNEVYAVRHIKGATSVRQLGELKAHELLQDPQTSTKETDGFNNFSSVFKATSTYQSVINAISGTDVTTAPSPFVALPTDDEEGAVTGVGGTTAHNPNYTTIGAHLDYVYENAVSPEKAIADLVPGIVFVGEIYDETGTKVDIMYKYNDKFYRTLEALVRDNDSQDGTSDGILTIGEHKITPNSTVDQAEAAKIDVYDQGRCYYYSAEIKHFDYAPGVATAERYMEHAIMRNNIYSLAVTGIKEMGDAHLTLSGQSPVIDVRAYITLKVSIIPWIVRFNDLEL